MKAILLFLCCITGFSASAQWYRVDKVFKSHKRLPQIEEPTNCSLDRIAAIRLTINRPKIHKIQVGRSDYSFHATEYVVMQEAQHNMRFRIYNDASYNFSDLAKLYIQQNRYSEAKWYLLQSNMISREENDDKHTVSNLIALASIKSEMGEYELALQDITEAHDIALAKGFRNDLPEIDKKTALIKLNKLTPARTDLRYAEEPMISGTKAE